MRGSLAPYICQTAADRSPLRSNIVGTQIFTAASAPGYVPGKVTILVLFSLMIPVTFAMRWYTEHLNKGKRAKIAQMILDNGWSEADVAREADRHAVGDFLRRSSRCAG